jgi:hypothetical protein
MEILKLLNLYEKETGKTLDSWELENLLKNDEKALRLFAFAIVDARDTLNHIRRIIED